MTGVEVLIVSAAALGGLELATGVLVQWLRQKCAWLITGRDRNPVIDEAGLDAFMEHGWDPELGWVRKPNTRHGEWGRLGVRTSYSLDRLGARTNPGFENRPVEILAYGDSYTFARQVNNHEAWPHILSQALDVNVANFGVGNYGLDQAQLRLEREFERHPARIVIMGVVPETICRIHAVWKHFSEYGNTFGFKPRFIIENSNLKLVPNVIDTRDKYFRIRDFYRSLAEYDYFYRRKFCRDVLEFPYLWSLAKSWQRNLPMMRHALSDRLGLTKDAAFINVMERNIDITAKLFHDPDGVALFKAVCRRFQGFCRVNGAEPVLLMMPQLMDMKRIRNGDHYYAPLLQDLSTEMTVVDLAPTLLAEADTDDLFIHDLYGGHLSTKGNQIVADVMRPVCRDLLDARGVATDDQEITDYPFARGDLLDHPNTYFYSPYEGRAFLAAWRRQRDGLQAGLKRAGAGPEPAAAPQTFAGDDGSVDTRLLLASLLHDIRTGNAEDPEVRRWLALLLKKFEVFKRVHAGYDAEFRALDRDDHKDTALYVAAAEVFEAAYAETGELPFLNALMKSLDTISALREEIDPAMHGRLGRVIEREAAHVSALAEGAGVAL